MLFAGDATKNMTAEVLDVSYGSAARNIGKSQNTVPRCRSGQATPKGASTMWKEAIRPGGVEVITGGASGVGLATAKECAMRGLSVVLADTSERQMAKAARLLSGLGSDIRTVKTDVSHAQAVERLADVAFELGPIALLMNNAGIARPTKSWDDPDNWHRMLEGNRFGVLNGVQAFLPRMIKADRPAVVINTGSKQGITTPPGNPG